MEESAPKRKLSTIMAADVVGYSEMMGRDEEHTLKTLREYRKIFDQLTTKHGGRIFNTAGDAILAEFDSAVEAVRCAVSIQEEISQQNTAHSPENHMLFRIGINVGDVMIEGNDLFGDGVNIAARLESVAAAGGVCISSTTFEQVKSKLSVGFEKTGPQRLKNIAEEVSAYRIVPGDVSVQRNPSRKKGRGKVLVLSILLIATFGAAAFFMLPGLIKEPSYPFDGRWQVTVDGRTGCSDNQPKTYPVAVIYGSINEPSQRIPKRGYVSEDGRFKIEILGKNGTAISSVDGIIKGISGRGRMSGATNRCTGDVTMRKLN